MAKSQQTFNKLEREKNKAKKREEKRKKMQARREARARGELKQDEFVYVDHLGNFRGIRHLILRKKKKLILSQFK